MVVKKVRQGKLPGSGVTEAESWKNDGSEPGEERKSSMHKGCRKRKHSQLGVARLLGGGQR